MWLSLTLFIILVFNGFLECVARASLLWSAVKSRYGSAVYYVENQGEAQGPNLFVSAHVAVHNEPPKLVIATLRSIAASDFSNFEVIVVDNNTVDPAIWRPVEQEVGRLGERFRFLHFEHLLGAKAGALNAALDHMNRHATHVAIIDADYQVSRTFFSDALRAAVSGAVDYVQFPQAYRGVSSCGRGVEQELGDYFACFSNGAGRRGSMLPTGTLSLFSVRALRAVGGWGVETITEDAELGVRLQAHGFRGAWRAERAGHGLLPVDFRGLARQRARWAAGNMQVLRQIICEHDLSFRTLNFFNTLAQLTAWISFWGLPAGTLALVALCPWLPLSRALGSVAGGTIILSFLLTAVRMTALLEPQEGRWSVNASALAVKLALTWTSAFAWLPATVNFPLRFYRTPKLLENDAGDRLAGMFLASAAFALFAVTFAFCGRMTEAIACSLLSAIWVCARSTDRRLRTTARLNALQV